MTYENEDNRKSVDELLFSNESFYHRTGKPTWSRRISPWLLHISAFIFYTVIFVVSNRSIVQSSERKSAEQISSWSPAFDAVAYRTTTFEGAFNQSSKYRGLPTPEIDAAWDAITMQPSIAISKDELVEKLGKDPYYSVHVTEDGTEKYFGFLEVFHQLHCVDMLRRYTWKEYYPDYPAFRDSDETMRTHLDHCLDILRINLMCTSDLSVMTYNWMAQKPWPNPDFEVTHKCRNFDAIVDWVNKTPRSRRKLIMKPEGAPIKGETQNLTQNLLRAAIISLTKLILLPPAKSEQDKRD